METVTSVTLNKGGRSIWCTSGDLGRGLRSLTGFKHLHCAATQDGVFVARCPFQNPCCWTKRIPPSIPTSHAHPCRKVEQNTQHHLEVVFKVLYFRGRYFRTRWKQQQASERASKQKTCLCFDNTQWPEKVETNPFQFKVGMIHCGRPQPQQFQPGVCVCVWEVTIRVDESN